MALKLRNLNANNMPEGNPTGYGAAVDGGNPAALKNQSVGFKPTNSTQAPASEKSAVPMSHDENSKAVLGRSPVTSRVVYHSVKSSKG